MTCTMPKFAPALALAFLAGACSNNSGGGVVLLDDGYTAEIVATEADGIASPDGLAWHDGALIIADEGGSAIRRWRSNRLETLASRRSGMISPEDLAVSADGTVFFTDDSAGGVWVVGQGTARRLQVPQIGNAPTEGIALTPAGNLFVGNVRDRKVVVVQHDQNATEHALSRERIAKPESIVVDKEGNLFVADNDVDLIYRFAALSGRRTILSWQGVSPESLTIVNGALWFTDSHNGKVYRVSNSGGLETVAIFAGELANVSGIAGDPAGSIYVSIQRDLSAGEGTIVALRPRS